jgi:hypothetical protein
LLRFVRPVTPKLIEAVQKNFTSFYSQKRYVMRIEVQMPWFKDDDYERLMTELLRSKILTLRRREEKLFYVKVFDAPVSTKGSTRESKEGKG